MGRFRLPHWRRLFRLPTPDPRDAAAEVDSELEFHLQMRIDELVALGMTEAEARAEALRRFGSVTEAREVLSRQGAARARRQGWSAWIEDLAQDLGFALRGVRRRPTLTAVAVATLALGLGLTTAVLAVVNRLVLHPLPYPEADRLAGAWLTTEQTAMRISPTLAMLGVWRARTTGTDWLEAHDREELLLEEQEAAELVQTRSVTPGLLTVLGARVAGGRGFEAADTAAGAPLVTLLSWGAWQRRFGGSREVIGRTVRLDGNIATIVGVVAKGFDLTPLDGRARAEFWLPMGGPGSAEKSVAILLRRRPGVSAAAVTSELRAGLRAAGMTSRMLETFQPSAFDLSELANEERERTLWLLTLAVSLVLAIACANVAALLLGQAAVRSREFGVRAALGAGRGRVMRQLITEAALLGGLGGALGFVVAQAALRLVRTTRPANLLTLDDVALDPRVMLFALGLTISVAMVFGIAPAWAASRTDAASVLTGKLKRSFDTRYGRALRSALVVGQLAASLVLVTSAGLLIRSFLAERNLPVEFDTRGLAWVDLDIPARVVPEPAVRDALTAEVLVVVAAMPGVDTAVLSGDSPMGYGITQGRFLIDGNPAADTGRNILMPTRMVGPGYFEAIGMRLDAGRAPDARPGSFEVVIDRQTAQRFFPAGDAIGSRIRSSDGGVWHTIVGVAPEQRALLGAFTNAPFLFRPPFAGEAGSVLILRARGALDLQRVSASIRAVDPRIRIQSVQTAESALGERLAGRRFTMTIVVAFAALALLLAAVGLYGVVALAVSQRTYELGVRIALGAAPRTVRRLVLRQGAIRVAAGLALGFVLTAGLGRLLSGLLSGVSAWDPAVWGGAAAVLAGAGILACWVPARRASRIDPMIALRAE